MIDVVRILCGGFAACGLLQPVFAQGSDAQSGAAEGAGRLQEVVVTAQKREESLQETPLAVSAITAETIEQRGTTDVSTLTAIAPNLVVTTSPTSTTNTTVYIRGIGSGEPVLTNDASVSIYVDGVVLGRQTGAVFDLVDLERIEVLRGPQGTLYGRNTIGGAVNFITTKPANELGFKEKLTYGSWNQWQTRTTFDTGQWGESGVRARLSYVHREQDGYVDDLNAPADRDPGALRVDAARLAVGFDRKGPFRADYAFDYNYRQSYAAAEQATVFRPDVLAYLNNSPALSGSAPVYSTRRLGKLRLDDGGLLTDKVTGHTLTMELDLGANTTLRSLTGYRSWRNVDRGDEMDGQAGLRGATASPLLLAPPPYTAFIPTGVQRISLFTSTNFRRQHQISQEFNLIGKVSDRLDYVAGLFYFKERSHERNPQFPTIVIQSLGVAVPLSTLLDFDHESESKAIFGQATYDFTDRLSFTGGMRYTKDDKKLEQRAIFPRNLEHGFSKFNWSATLDFKVSDRIMTYGRVATGYKAGGFNARAASGAFEPEDVTSFELGLKSELLDRRLRLNAAAFYVDHKDMQVDQFQAGSQGATSVTVNAGKAEYKGLEAEIEAVLAKGLTLSGSVGYIDRKYKEFLILDPVTNQIVDVARSAFFTYAPKLTADAALQYDLPRFDIGQLSTRLEYNYRGRVIFYPTVVGTPLTEAIAAASRGLLDARVTLSELKLGGGTASVSLWGKNLTDEEYRVHGIDFGAMGFATSVYGEPRSVGIDFIVAF
ncbi:MAG: TonB-dependent receptor [Gammaproteobacteria bacterium]|nr:TonB-dependent receptor [Gammaproteobacteria bacterium]